MSRWSARDRSDALARYKAGEPYERITKATGVPRRTLRYWARREGIPGRSSGRRDLDREKAWAVQGYAEEWSVADLAYVLGRHKKTIRAWLRGAGVTLRPARNYACTPEQARLALARQRTQKAAAYVLGITPRALRAALSRGAATLGSTTGAIMMLAAKDQG